MNLIKHEVDSTVVEQRLSDGYINATKLAKAYEAGTGVRKDVRDWLVTERAKTYIEYLSAKTGIPVLELAQVKKGGNAPGTWLHPKLATPFGTWLSVEYEFQVSEWIEQWMTTKQNPIQSPEPQPEPKPDRPQLKKLPVIMPTPEEIEFMRSPSARSHPNWMQLSGYDRALEVVRKHRNSIVPQ